MVPVIADIEKVVYGAGKVDVSFAKQGNVQPQMFAKTAAHPLAGFDVGFHAPRHHIARGQFLFLRFVIRHEAMSIDISQQAAIATTALGHQNAGREDGGGVELATTYFLIQH